MGKKKNIFADFDPGEVTRGAMEKLGSDESVICGVPVPSIAMQHILNSTVLPLGRIMEVYGQPGAGKSTFLYELMRWFVDVGGNCYLGETEQKDSASIRRAILRYDFEKAQKIYPHYESSFEGWTKALKSAFEFFDSQYDKSGPKFPVLYGIDAVTSVETESSIEEYSGEGEVKTGYARLALHIAKFLRMLPAMYFKKPYLVVFLNHVKKDTSKSWGNTDLLPGGSSLYYGSHLILELEYIGQVKKANSTIRNIRIRIEKNGVQEKGKNFIVPIKYWSIPDPTDPTLSLQQVYYDWSSADIKFLLDQMDSKENGAERRKAVASLIDLHPARLGTENAVWSDALGISESDPANFTEAGDILHKNEEVMKRLQGFFVTTNSVAFKAGMDYNTLLEDENKKQMERYKAISDALYKQIASEELK